MSRITVLIFVLAGGMILSSCSPKVSRIDSQQQVDLSGRWNDTDSRLVAEQMVQDVLSRGWLTNHIERTGDRPIIVVGNIKNKSSEHINTDTFIKDIEREILNSGRARIVQAGIAREQLRKERADQQDFASPETIKEWGRELGADYILQGTLSSIRDSNNRQKLIFYQVDLELTNIETNEKVWIGNKKIKKLVK